MGTGKHEHDDYGLENDIKTLLVETGKRGYRPGYFVQMIKIYGTENAVRRLACSGNLEDGLIKLVKLGLERLSVEAICEKNVSLFSSEEREAAREKLDLAVRLAQKH